MKLEVLQENLNHGLSTISRVLSSKPQIVILSHILLVARQGKLILTASNQETTIITEIGAKVEASGEFTLPGRTFAEIIASLSAEKITLELDGTVMSVKTSGFKATINGTPAAEYPTLVPDTDPKDPTWEIDSAIFQELIAKTVFSAATDEGRAALTGVLFKSGEAGLTLAATDGFRLSVFKQTKLGKSSTKEEKSSLIIPAKSLLEVTRILAESKTTKSDKDQNLKIKISVFEQSNQIFFDLGDIKIYSRLIAGSYPDFEKIIPTTSTIKLSIEAQELSKAIRLASIFARESANIVKFQIGNLPAGEAGSKLKISANAPQVGENESEVEFKSDSKEEISIAFNFHYLLDFLSVASVGEITIELSGPTSPGVFRSPSDPNFLHLIMPVRVQG